MITIPRSEDDSRPDASGDSRSVVLRVAALRVEHGLTPVIRGIVPRWFRRELIQRLSLDVTGDRADLLTCGARTLLWQAYGDDGCTWLRNEGVTIVDGLDCFCAEPLDNQPHWLHSLRLFEQVTGLRAAVSDHAWSNPEVASRVLFCPVGSRRALTVESLSQGG